MNDQLLRSIFGIDISFDHANQRDVRSNQLGHDFEYVTADQALAEELYRLFDLTPVGSFFDDPSYGLDWEWIGRPADPRVMVALTKLAVKRALTHPSFRDRFRVLRLDVSWSVDEPTAIFVKGVLGLFGFEALEGFEFTYRLRGVFNG
ncbi:MAG: hypothetical protein DDT26_00814 [Dehalococcoidia bacterium]|nr:hypothetical protein [Chloroflexota bacterium]